MPTTARGTWTPRGGRLGRKHLAELWGFFRRLAENDLKERTHDLDWTYRLVNGEWVSSASELINARAVDLVNREVDWRPTRTHK